MIALGLAAAGSFTAIHCIQKISIVQLPSFKIPKIVFIAEIRAT
jgi:hypothetical protein